jgi:hypothetical protein
LSGSARATTEAEEKFTNQFDELAAVANSGESSFEADEITDSLQVEAALGDAVASEFVGDMALSSNTDTLSSTPPIPLWAVVFLIVSGIAIVLVLAIAVVLGIYLSH